MTSSTPTGLVEEPERPTVSYMICTTQRSGSGFLRDALTRTKVAGVPDEHFIGWIREVDQPNNLNEYEKLFCSLSPANSVKQVLHFGTCNGVFGVKMMQGYLDLVVRKLRPLATSENQSAAELFRSIFPNLHYIYLIREDKVRQAVSLAKAIQSDEWESYRWTPLSRMFKRFKGSGPRLEYDFAQISHLHRTLIEESGRWEDFFRRSNIQPFRLTYESFVGSYDHTLREILKFLGIAYPEHKAIPQSVLRQQSDAINDEWARRFVEDSRRLEAPGPER